MPNWKWTPESNDNVGDYTGVPIGASEDGRVEIYTYCTIAKRSISRKRQECDAQRRNTIGFSDRDLSRLIHSLRTSDCGSNLGALP
jgi:hypothetical protein